MQQATVTARIIRHDFPNNWPDAIDKILPIVQISLADVTHTQYTFEFQRNALYTLHQIMKTLSTKTLLAPRRIFQQLAPIILELTTSIVTKNLDAFHTVNTKCFTEAEEVHWNEVLTIARIALKCTRRLVVRGIDHLESNTPIVQFLLDQLRNLDRFLQLRNKFVFTKPALA